MADTKQVVFLYFKGKLQFILKMNQASWRECGGIVFESVFPVMRGLIKVKVL